MLYHSTRRDNTNFTGSQAILTGLAPDGGLFVPSSIPKIDYTKLLNTDYYTLGAEILSLYLPEFSNNELNSFFKKAYSIDKFRDDILRLTNTGKNEYTLELWHGPTAAFKDFALVLLPYIVQESKKLNDIKTDTVILVATSGDTGKAALEGYKDIEGIEIAVFYPDNGTSEIQRLQMCTQEGNNVKVFALNGNFDDVQTSIKQAFLSSELKDHLSKRNKVLSSANSINWGRLLPQIVYYFYAYITLVNRNNITLGDTIDFCVPSGNFGDILAGYYAKEMGLPIGTLICASNANNILTDFLQTGVYNTNREFYKTISPSMDILVSSNLERLLYSFTQDSTMVEAYYKSLAESKSFSIPAEYLHDIQKTFFAGYANDIAVLDMIKQKYTKENYLCDPHTATAYCVLEQYKKKNGSSKPCVVLSTASPYKFSPDVLKALGNKVPENEFESIKILEEFTGTHAPDSITSLHNKPVRFSTVVEPSNIIQTIKEIFSV